MKPSLKLLRDSRGVAAIEYAMIASLISVAAIGGYSALGSNIRAYFGNIDSQLAAHM